MKELNLQEIQGRALGLLIEFHRICQEQSFRYSLGGGSLLGAVRHKGFIPWDDDIDIMMPRPDYEKFLDYCHGNSINFLCFSNKYNDNYYNLFAKISDLETYSLDERNFNSNQIGVNIDIFPIDGLGNSKSEAIKNFKRTSFQRELLIASKWEKYSLSKTKALYLEPIRFILYLLGKLVDKQQLCARIEDNLGAIYFEDSDYAGCVSGVYRLKEIKESSIFKSFTTLEFSGNKFNVIKEYDRYLSSHYGNYMELPPKEKQVTHHTAKYFWK